MTDRAAEPSYSCACFYTDNIFIEEYQLHVRFTDAPQFTRDYERALQSRGCHGTEKFARVLETVKKEVHRRMRLAEESMHRKVEISLYYKPLHPEVYVLQESFLTEEFLEAVHFCESHNATLEGLLNHLHSIPGKRIYCFPLFLPQFCTDFVAELENFEKSQLDKGRPNTMNNYGVLLNELGLDESFITPLREKYLRPIASIIYPDWGGGYLDSHKAFVVQYSEDKDLDLSCHYDNSEVTLNVSLGKAFTDGNLYFSDMREFCTDFVAELENFEKSQLDKGRPNTMNNYGVLLNELGLDESFITPLREKYLRPITSIIYPDWGGGYLDSHKAFVVQYSEDKDLDLSCHYDNSEVTLNVSLGKAFTDGNLYFSDMREVPSNERRYTEVEHTIGRGILHRGQQVHGALPITSGERWNLIIWMRASSIRNKQCPMCHKEPQLVETMGEGDGFTVIRKEDRGEAVNVCTLI